MILGQKKRILIVIESENTLLYFEKGITVNRLLKGMYHDR